MDLIINFTLSSINSLHHTMVFHQHGSNIIGSFYRTIIVIKIQDFIIILIKILLNQIFKWMNYPQILRGLF